MLKCISCRTRTAVCCEETTPSRVFCGKECQDDFYIGLQTKDSFGNINYVKDDEEEYVTFATRDRVDVTLPVRLAKKMETLKNLIEDAGVDNPIPLPNIDSATFQFIVNYATDREEEEEKYELNLNDTQFFRLLIAANYLDYIDLLNVLKPEIGQRVIRTQLENIALDELRSMADLFYDSVYFLPNDTEVVEQFQTILREKTLQRAADQIDPVLKWMRTEGAIGPGWGIVLALKTRRLDMLPLLLKQHKQSLWGLTISRILEEAIALNDLDVFRMLLEHPMLQDGRYRRENVTEEAAKMGRAEIVAFLLSSSERVNPHDSLDLAAGEGHANVVALLLKDGRAIPTRLTLRSAVEGGNAEVLKLLLDDGRVDPSLADLVGYAAIKGNVEMIRLLLADGRENPGGRNNMAIRNAASMGHVEIVELLLKDARVDPADYFNDAIIQASLRGNAEVVKLLLKDGRVNPAARGNAPIRFATQNGHVQVVELLLPVVGTDIIPELLGLTTNTDMIKLLKSKQ